MTRHYFLKFFALAAWLLLTTTSMAEVSPDERIAALAGEPAVREALAQIVAMEEELIDDLIELTEIPAPPFQEEQRAARFAELLAEAGLTEIYTDEVGNVVGRRPGTSGERTVAYMAHLDTVFPAETDVTVQVEGDVYTAPGVGDNTRGLVVVLGVLRAMQRSAIATDADVLFIGNVGEEGLGDLRGVKYLFSDDGPQIDSMIAVDGGTPGRIVYAGVGSHRYRVTFEGPGGHSWGAFGTANPAHALGRAIAIFVGVAPSVTATGEKTTYNVGRIGGGTSINSVPFEAWMEVDMRSGSQLKLDEIDVVFQEAVGEALLEENAARLEGPPLTVSVESVGKRPAASNDSNLALVETASAALRFLGQEPDLAISSTDANIPISLGIPAITMSRGGISTRSHSLDESWRNVDGYIGIQAGLLTLLADAGFAGVAD